MKDIFSRSGVPIDMKDSQVTKCHLLFRDNICINQSLLGVNIRWGNVPAMEFTYHGVQEQIYGLQRKIKARKVRARTRRF
jgi:hypothetical protein